MAKAGNPLFGKKYTILARGEEPLTTHLQLKITASMSKKLGVVGDKNEFIRQAIADALSKIDQAKNHE